MTSFTSNSDSGGRTSFRSVSDARLAILVLHPMDIRTTPCPDSWQSFMLREWSSHYGTQISCLLCPPPLPVASFLFTSPRLLPSPTYSFCLFLFPPLSSAVLFPLSCSLYPLSISSYSSTLTSHSPFFSILHILCSIYSFTLPLSLNQYIRYFLSVSSLI